MQTIRIAIDAMSGDYGPRFAVQAARTLQAAQPQFLPIIFLTEYAAKELTAELEGFEVNTAETVVGMSEKPTDVLRNGLSSTMAFALDAVVNGEADICISAGNTGALLALAWKKLGMLPDYDRPVIGSLLPADEKGRKAVVMDLGANLDCKPKLLLQFAKLGENLMKNQGIQNPAIALLNIGTEENKGSAQIIKASKLFEKQFADQYIGFVEATKLYNHKADVVVCDGLLGNVALKASEATVDHLLALLPEQQQTQLREQLAPEYNSGALLLGLNGLVVKTHGNSEQLAWQSALEFALGSAQQIKFGS